MIGIFAAGTTDPLFAKNQNNFFISKMSIAILRYLEAKFDNNYSILIFALKSYNYTLQISNNFEQK